MSEEADKQTSLDAFNGSAPRTLNLPSQNKSIQPPPSSTSTRYHDMEKLHPDAPVPKVADGLVRVFHEGLLQEAILLVELIEPPFDHALVDSDGRHM